MRRLAFGFTGHVLEMEGTAGQRPPWLAANELFDLDMDSDDISWRRCPDPQARLAGRGGQTRVA